MATEISSATNDEELHSLTNLGQMKKHRLITIEPVIGAVFLAQVLSDSVLTEFYLKRTCEVELALNATFCASLGTNTSEGHDAETIVQPYAAHYLKWKTVIQSVLPAIFSLFLGPWSDHYGRKFIIGFSLAGTVMMYVAYVIMSMVPHLPPGYLLIGVVPLALMGGQLNMTSACSCFLSDIIPENNRSFRMSILESVIQGAQLVGLPLAGIIFSNTKALKYPFATNFGLSGALCFSALIYLIFFVNESVNVREDTTRKWANLFDLAYPKEVWRTCTQARPGNRRTVIFLCAFVLASFILILEGEAQIAFLFVRLQFGWDLEWFTTVGAILLAVIIVGTVGGVLLLKKIFQISDAYLTLLSFLGDIANNVLRAVATPSQSYFMFIGGGLSFLKGVVSPAIRSILSTTVPAHDLGKVFAFTFSLENILPIAAGPLFVSVYDATIPDMPGAVFLMSAAIYCLTSVCVIIVAVIQIKHPKSRGLVSR